MPLILRASQSAALTYEEMDNNFIFLSSSIPNIDVNLFPTTGSNQFNGDQTITGSLSQGIENITIGGYSHAEGYNTIAGIQAYYSDNILNGNIIIAGYGDIISYFPSGSFLILDDSSQDNNYGIIKLQISQSYVDSGNVVIDLYDTTVNTTEASIGTFLYPILPNSDYTIGPYSHAEGSQTQAIGNSSHAEGYNTKAIGQGSHAEGTLTQTLADNSHAEGYYTQTIGQYSHAEGYSTQAIGDNSHAEGFETISLGSTSHAEGNTTQTIGPFSHAEGIDTQAIGEASHAEGDTTQAIGYASHAEGLGTIASGSYQHISGKYNTHGDNTSLFIVGNGTVNNRSDAFKVRQSGSIVLPVTSSGQPNWTGTQGEMIFGDDGSGNYVIWAYLGGDWRSGSLF